MRRPQRSEEAPAPLRASLFGSWASRKPGRTSVPGQGPRHRPRRPSAGILAVRWKTAVHPALAFVLPKPPVTRQEFQPRLPQEPAPKPGEPLLAAAAPRELRPQPPLWRLPVEQEPWFHLAERLARAQPEVCRRTGKTYFQTQPQPRMMDMHSLVGSRPHLSRSAEELVQALRESRRKTDKTCFPQDCPFRRMGRKTSADRWKMRSDRVAAEQLRRRSRWLRL
jgi:hypothetical protein